MKKLSTRQWLSFIVAGFVGQLAWAIENNYLNRYVFYCTGKADFVPFMVAFSALAATLTTLLMGALSDRLGKRKSFIAFGYILWGISIILFAFLSPTSKLSFVGNSVFLSGTMIVIMDCIMTFFGSTANDSAFNAFVTDQTSENNRGLVESVLSILPLVSMIVIVLIGGIFVDNSTPAWDTFFYVFGGLTIAAGIGCIFLLPKDEIKPNKEETYIKNIFYGFRPKVIKDNKLLYILLICFCIFNIGIQIFMPYLMIYIENGLKITEGDYTLTLGIVLGVSCLITVLVGAFMEKIGKNKIMIPSVLVCAVGAVLMFFAKNQIFVIIAATVMMSGYLIGTAVLGAKIRDYTPEAETGLFQGIRMVFVVLIPMVTGPFIGEGVSHINPQTYVNMYGETAILPNNFIFLFTAILLPLAIIPIVIYLSISKKEASNNDK